MKPRITANSIDWEEFHRRFEGIDWADLDEDREELLSCELLWEHLESDDSSRMEAERCEEGLEKLAKYIRKENSKLFWRRVFWWRSESKLTSEGKPVSIKDSLMRLREIGHWMEEADFVFRLSPLFFNHASERYQDSPIDFSYFLKDGIEIDTVSPNSVKAIAQRLPPPLLETFPELRLKIEGGKSDKYFGDIDHYLHFWRDIVEKAERSGNGLCIFVA